MSEGEGEGGRKRKKEREREREKKRDGGNCVLLSFVNTKRNKN